MRLTFLTMENSNGVGSINAKHQSSDCSKEETLILDTLETTPCFDVETLTGLVPRYLLQKPPSRGLEGSGGERGRNEGLKVEGGFTFERLQGGLQGGLKGASRSFKGASRALEGGFTFGRLQGGLKGASRGLQGGWKGA